MWAQVQDLFFHPRQGQINKNHPLTSTLWQQRVQRVSFLEDCLKHRESQECPIGIHNDKVMHGGSDALRISAERYSIAGPDYVTV